MKWDHTWNEIKGLWNVQTLLLTYTTGKIHFAPPQHEKFYQPKVYEMSRHFYLLTLQVRFILLPHSTRNFTNYHRCVVLVSSHTSSIPWWHISDRHLYKTSILQIARGATAMGGRTLQVIANINNTIFGHASKGVTLVCHWYLLSL